MFESESEKDKLRPPPCPLCDGEMNLKQIFRQKPADHLVYKCGNCAIEYPVVQSPR